MVISVKFCGSCNPHYDGAEAVRQLQEGLGCRFVAYDHGQLPDISIVVKQCTSECICPEDFPGKIATFLVDKMDIVPYTIWQIKKMRTEAGGVLL